MGTHGQSLSPSVGTLIVFGGLPGTGKTAIARDLAGMTGALYIRIDSVEQAIRNSGAAPACMNDLGYRVAYAVAEDNLHLGRIVIADCVNPLNQTRDAWRAAAHRAGASVWEIEVVCSDRREHQKRVETRSIDVAGLKAPTWPEVLSRDYEPWTRDHLVVDTAQSTVRECVSHIIRAIPDLSRASSGSRRRSGPSRNRKHIPGK